MITTYSLQDRAQVAPEQLQNDIPLARALAVKPSEHGPLDQLGASSAVAAAALWAHTHGTLQLNEQDAEWAAELLLEQAATHPETPEEQGTHMSPDRSAADGLPALLMANIVDVERQRLQQALFATARNPSMEVRLILAHALEPVWSSPCEQESVCRHRIAFQVVEEILTDSRLGEWSMNTQSHGIMPLPGPVAESLSDVPAESLLVDRLTPAIIATYDAARSGSCVAGHARELCTGCCSRPTAAVPSTGRGRATSTATRTERQWPECC